jgi:hypothetical protein
MKRAIIVVAVAIACHFAAVAGATIYYLMLDAPEFPPIASNPVYWMLFGALLTAAGWRLTPLGFRRRKRAATAGKIPQGSRGSQYS